MLLFEIPGWSMDTSESVSTARFLSTPSIRLYRRVAVFHWDCNRIYLGSLFRYGEMTRTAKPLRLAVVSRILAYRQARANASNVRSVFPASGIMAFLLLSNPCWALSRNAICRFTCNHLWQLLFAFSDFPETALVVLTGALWGLCPRGSPDCLRFFAPVSSQLCGSDCNRTDFLDRA
jgi:hypothetical protein